LSDQHPIRTGVLVRVIGGLILAFLFWTALFPAVWHALKKEAIWLYNIFLSSVSIPVWLIVVFPFIIFALIRMFAVFREKNQISLVSWREYNHDLIFGMCWRWGYSSSNADIERLWCFCPHDDTELISEGIHSQSFRCETCKRKFGPFEDSQGDLFGMVKRQIHRKLRSGEWKPIVEKLKSEGCHQ
jgi:hypothetical protein